MANKLKNLATKSILPPEHVPDFYFQLFQNPFKSIECQVLLPNFQAL